MVILACIKVGFVNVCLSEEIAPVYQMVRMAFYAMKLGTSFEAAPIVVSLANRRN